jgi:hypothetical protein
MHDTTKKLVVGRLTLSLPRVCAAFVIAASMSVSHAQTAAKSGALPEPVQVSLDRKKVSLVDGKEQLVPATSAKPGEVIEEVATYSNRSKKTFKVDATLPVPQYTELVIDSTRPTNVKASVDGKVFAPLPLTRKVKQPNGVEVQQLVPVSEYRFLRWTGVDLGPEKSFAVSARFKLNDSANPSTVASKR